jgi:hypothetical protein
MGTTGCNADQLIERNTGFEFCATAFSQTEIMTVVI